MLETGSQDLNLAFRLQRAALNHRSVAFALTIFDRSGVVMGTALLWLFISSQEW